MVSMTNTRLKARLASIVMTLMLSAGGLMSAIAPALAAAPVHHSRQVDPRQVRILYSEDGALCHPLARLYNKLSHQHPHEIDWEDRYADLFKSIGFRQPKPLVDALHPFQDKRHRAYYYRHPFEDKPRRAYYRLRFFGGKSAHIVYLEDIADHDAFRTDVWIFKRGMDIDEGTFFNLGDTGGPGPQFQADKIALATLFASPQEGYGAYDRVNLPYYFHKIITKREFEDHYLGYRIFSVPGLSGSTTYLEQRPFMFGSRAVVLAENGDMYLVYTYRDHAINDVCYFATAFALNRIRILGGWAPEGEKP